MYQSYSNFDLTVPITGALLAPLVASPRGNWAEIKQNYKTPKLYAFGGLVTGLDAVLFPHSSIIQLYDLKRVQPADWKPRTMLNVLGATKLSLFVQGCQYVSDMSRTNAITRLCKSPNQILVLTAFLEGIHQVKKFP